MIIKIDGEASDRYLFNEYLAGSSPPALSDSAIFDQIWHILCFGELPQTFGEPYKTFGELP